MVQDIFAWESEDGEFNVIGTHDREQAIKAIKIEALETNDAELEDEDFRDITSAERWVRPDWEIIDEGDKLYVDRGEGLPTLFFEDGIMSSWHRRNDELATKET